MLTKTTDKFVSVLMISMSQHKNTATFMFIEFSMLLHIQY